MKSNIQGPGVIVIDGHVQGLALTRSLGEKGIPVFVVDSNNYGVARFSKYCSKFFKCPDYLSEQFVDFLINLGDNEGLKDWLLLPCDDHIVFSISKRKNDLQKIYKVITVDFDILKNIINKQNLFTVASKLGLPVIKTLYPEKNLVGDDEISGFRFPLLVKGIEGQTFYKKTNNKAFKVNNRKELNIILRTLPDTIVLKEVMIQEMIPLENSNKVISFTAFCIRGEIKSFWMGQKIREHPIYFGTATMSKSIYNQAILEQVKPLLKELNYEGVCEVEFIEDPRDGKYYLIEINARTWLWVGLAKACGIDYAIQVYNYVNNIPQEFSLSYKSNIFWKNEITDFIFTVINILKGKIKLKEFIRFWFKYKVKALWYKSDSRPFWGYLFLLPYIFLKRR
jgi:predicted ATP-grasp superfamily ATP-dependent carboligase